MPSPGTAFKRAEPNGQRVQVLICWASSSRAAVFCSVVIQGPWVSGCGVGAGEVCGAGGTGFSTETSCTGCPAAAPKTTVRRSWAGAGAVFSSVDLSARENPAAAWGAAAAIKSSSSCVERNCLSSHAKTRTESFMGLQLHGFFGFAFGFFAGFFLRF